MSASCRYCAANHRDPAEARFCFALFTACTILGAQVIEASAADMKLAERVEAQVRREARQRAAGLTPRGRAARGRQRTAEPARRPLAAPVPTSAPRVVVGPAVDNYRTGRAS